MHILHAIASVGIASGFIFGFVAAILYFGRLDRKSVFTLRQVPPSND